jgi:hypothetical protein
MLLLPLVILWAVHLRATVLYLADPGQDIVSQEQYDDWVIIGEQTPANAIILASGQSGINGTERFFAQYYADRFIPHFPDIATLVEYAPKIKAAVDAQTQIYVYIRPDQEEETRRVFAAQQADLESIWRNDRVILLRYSKGS